MSITPAVLKGYDKRSLPPEATESATFGLGCFWGPDAAFGAIDGVVRTRVGYAGGTTPNPSYHTLGDHTEVLQVDYDPERITYEELLAEAFELHDPTRQPSKARYQHLVLTENADQRDAVDRFRAAKKFDDDSLQTRIEPLSEFRIAEPYHQTHHLNGKRWVTAPFQAAGYDEEAIRESPAATKLNAHVAGHDVDVPFIRSGGRRFEEDVR